VGCSAIAPTMLPLNSKGEPLRNAILYGIDNRAEKEIFEMTERIGEDKLIKYNGILLSSQAAGPKILWFIKMNQSSLRRQPRSLPPQLI